TVAAEEPVLSEIEWAAPMRYASPVEGSSRKARRFWFDNGTNRNGAICDGRAREGDDDRHQPCAFDDDVAVFKNNMNIETLHIGMKVRHPKYGVGLVRSLTEQTAEIAFDDAQRTIAPASSDLQPAEPTAKLSELELPLANLIRDTAHAVVEALGLEQQDVLVEGL